ncbi:MAG TPA: hypothetical protein VK324_13775 [Tepidisphaeraceae bacterium]|nr:hypothetical protein [Tepidisphaeraceae bacterium]
MTQMIDAPPDSAVTNRDQGTPPPAGNLPTPSAPPVQVLDAKRVNSPAGERGLQLKSYDELARFSATVYKSGLAPKGFDTAEAVFVAIQMGMECGLSPMAALRSIAVVNGRPAIYGDAALALVRSSGLLEDISEHYEGSPGSDEYRAVCVTKRKGASRPVERSFSVKDARSAALLGKSGPWTQYRDRMMLWRARGYNLRDNFGDVLQGMYTFEEARDIPADGPQQQQQASERGVTALASKLGLGGTAEHGEGTPGAALDAQATERAERILQEKADQARAAAQQGGAGRATGADDDAKLENDDWFAEQLADHAVAQGVDLAVAGAVMGKLTVNTGVRSGRRGEKLKARKAVLAAVAAGKLDWAQGKIVQ